MKRYILIALATALILLCACSKTPEPTEPASEAPSTQPTESEMPTIPSLRNHRLSRRFVLS